MNDLLAKFDQIRIINLPERKDRRREVTKELARIGALGDPQIAFFDAVKPTDPADFPSLGARGCFMSHLDILRAAVADGVGTLLIIEDDFNFTDDFAMSAREQIDRLFGADWDIFYGAYRLHGAMPVAGIPLSPEIAVETTAFVAFNSLALPRVIAFLEGILTRPAGSPDYGPMHVDGAYSVFRRLHPDVVTYVASPKLGYQRSSRSDISDSQPLIDRIPVLRDLATLARRVLKGRIGTA
ncbi:glycosyltransferase family 25 protein [Sphingomonas sp. GB1N7]|uniref:glycosyltransferase family 25 protein n=1 Tax=Parasphingomonas caseinilytica TaxID=3096158 RepID=UPI002FC8A9D6